MKKLNLIFGLAILSVVLLTSCNDETGQFVEQLHTNVQKNTAIKACLKVSADSALNHLCDNNGFYDYQDGVYRIDYAPLQSSLFDTLENHGYGYLADTLIRNTNLLAASCKAQLAAPLKEAIDSLKVIDYDALLHGDGTPITDYFELYKYRTLKSAFQQPVSIRMDLFNVSGTWALMVHKYIQYTNTPLNFDIQNYIVEEILDDILEEMRVEEELIRSDSTHRNEDMHLFGK
jgi:hypothetical protein